MRRKFLRTAEKSGRSDGYSSQQSRISCSSWASLVLSSGGIGGRNGGVSPPLTRTNISVDSEACTKLSFAPEEQLRLKVCVEVCLKIVTSPAAVLRSIVMSVSVCVSDCPPGYLWNHTRDLYLFVAYVHGSVLLRHVDDRPHRLSAGRGWREWRCPCLKFVVSSISVLKLS